MSGSTTSSGGAMAVAFALFGGLCAWFARLVVGVGMVGWACTAGLRGRAALLAVMVACGVVAVAALIAARRLRQRSESLHFVAGVGTLLNLVALAGIVFESGVTLFVDPCLSAP